MKATKKPEKNDTTKIGLGRVLPRLDPTSDAPVKLIFLILYILGAVLILNAQADIAASTEKIEYISPIAEYAAKNIFATYLIVAGIAVTIAVGQVKDFLGLDFGVGLGNYLRDNIL